MKRKAHAGRSRRNRRRLFAEALEPRLLLAVDTWILDLDANGSIDLFDPNAAGDLGDEYEQNPLSDGNIIGTSNVPGQNNQAPIAVDDAVTTDQEAPLSGDVLVANPTTPDSDPDSDPISVTAVEGMAGNVGVLTALTSGATVNLAAAGTFTYDPNGAFDSLAAGSMTTDTFTYTIEDSFGASDSAVVTVSITGLNDAPAATNLTQTQTYLEDAASVALNDIVVTDLDVGDTVTATLSLTNTTTGSLTATSGNGETYTPGTGIWTVAGSVTAVNAALAAVAFTPAANNVATSTITTHVEDAAAAGPADGAITLTATAVNDEPSFTKGADETVLEDAGAQSVAGWATGLSKGPADEAGQTLSFNIASNSNAGLFSVAPAVSASGTLTYTPAANANGSAVITLNIVDNGGTANGGDDTSPDQTFTISVTAVNDEPSFTKGADPTVLEDAGTQTVVGWATGLSKGPADEAGQTLSFNITGNNNPGLFSVAPTVNSSGDLSYTPAANANGSAVITLNIMDNGGTANGGDDTSPDQTFTINVTAVNDVPSFTSANDTVLEDAGAQTVIGWATGLSAGPADEAGQTLSFNITGNSNGPLFSVAPTVNSSGDLSYTPAANANGSAVITLNVMDDGGTANGGDDTSPDQTFTISVTAVNDEPSFTKGDDETVLEDAGAQTVPSWATGLSKGPADESGQTLSFNITSNSNAGLFSAGPAVDSTGQLTYTPAANANGSAVITLNIMDNGGTANGGDDTSPDQTFTINVTAVNDPPVFSNLDGLLTADGSVVNTGSNQSVTQSEVQWLTDEAVSRWEATGISAAQREALLGISYEIGDLSQGRLGSYNDGVITVDADAAGRGWFVDPTPGADEEFSLEAGQMLAQPDSAASARMDLLTFLLHEQGHALGLDHVPATSGSANVMISTLRTGLRRLPESGQALGASPGSVTGAQFMGTTIVVPIDQATITAAVAAASAGDTIQINSGTYNESVDVSAGAGSLIFLGNDTGGGKPIINAASGPAFYSSGDTADFTFDNLEVRSNSGTSPEDGINLLDVTGTIQILNTTINDPDNDGIVITNTGTTQSDVLISNVTIISGANLVRRGITLSTSDTTSIDATIVDSNITHNNGPGINLDPNNGSTLNVTMEGNTISGTSTQSPISLNIDNDPALDPTVNLAILNNTLTSAAGDAVNFLIRDGVTNALISGNTFPSTGDDAGDDAIRMVGNLGNAGIVNARITGNTFGTSGSIAGRGILLEGNDGTTTYNLVIDNNNFAKTNSLGGAGAFVLQAEGATYNLDIRSNTIGSFVGATTGFSIDNSTTPGTVTVEDASPNDNTTSNAKGEIEDNNTYSGSGSEVVISGTVGYSVGGNAVNDANIPVLIGGFVFDDSNADGLSTGEMKVAGVRIDLSGAATGTTFTDANGNYQFSVVPGSYTLTITEPTGKQLTTQDAGMNDAIDSDYNTGTKQVTVMAADNTNKLDIDAGLVTPPPPFEQLDTNVTVTDPELAVLNAGMGNYNLATLQIQRNGGANANDEFSNTGTLGTLTEGLTFMVGATTIGTVTTNSGGTLLLTFNGNATSALVNQALQGITHRDITQPASLQLDYTFNDQNTGSQGTGGALTGTGSVTVTYPLRAAAGFGWFVDATPGDNVEFDTFVADTELAAGAGSEAFGAIDLMTVVMHELGHVLGKAHTPDAPHNVMAEDLTTGTRRLLAADQEPGVRSQESAEVSDPPDAHGAVDVNGDGVVSPLDALLIINAMEKKDVPTAELAALDINGDGIVSPLDALLVFNRLLTRQLSPADQPAQVDGPLPASVLELDALHLDDNLLDLLAADVRWS